MVVSLCFGGHSVRETPGYIPNPEAKPYSADGTAGGTLWESRTPPNNLWRTPGRQRSAGARGPFCIYACSTRDRSHRCPPTLPTTDRSATSGDGTVVTARTGGTVAASVAAAPGAATTATVASAGTVTVPPSAATTATGTVTVVTTATAAAAGLS